MGLATGLQTRDTLEAWVVHEDMPCIGEIFSCGGGRSARVIMGEVRSFQAKIHRKKQEDTYDLWIYWQDLENQSHR